MAADHKLAFWLLPAPAPRDVFRSLVHELAARYEAPEFEPHLTLCAGDFDPSFDFASVQERDLPPFIELEVDSIEQSEKYTKTLFVRFKPNAELSALRKSIADLLEEEADGSFDPHVSLMYKTMPAHDRAKLAASVALPFERVRFDRITAIKTPAQIDSPEDVHAWQTLWERSLTP
jgi:hypothetical protein